MLTEVRLYGALGEKFGQTWELNIQTPAEAIRAIACQTNGFEEFLTKDETIGYRVVSENPEGMTIEETLYQLRLPVVYIYPETFVSGGNFGKILLGAALIGVAFLVPGGILGISAKTIGLIGGALIFSGVRGLLTGTPKKPKESEKQDSHLFGRGSATSEQGVAVPVAYGRRRAKNMIVISAGMVITRVDLDD